MTSFQSLLLGRFLVLSGLVPIPVALTVSGGPVPARRPRRRPHRVPARALLAAILAGAAGGTLSAQDVPDELESLVERLGDESWERRQDAEQELLERAIVDPDGVRAALDLASGDPEVTARVKSIRSAMVWRLGRERVLSLLSGPARLEGVVSDDRLRPWVELVHESPSINGYEFDPARLLRVAEELRLLGRDGALEVLREYARLCRTPALRGLDDQRILLVLRVLFDPPAGEGFRALVIGQPDLLASPSDPGWARFPIAVRRDVPFLVVQGYELGGEAEPAGVQIDWCADRGVFRATALAPGTPIEAAQELLDSEAWGRLRPPDGSGGPGPGSREMVLAQATRASAAIGRR